MEQEHALYGPAVLAGPEARTEATTAANMRFAASVAIRSLRQTLRSVTAVARRRSATAAPSLRVRKPPTVSRNCPPHPGKTIGHENHSSKAISIGTTRR